jgi:hypothetical protein
MKRSFDGADLMVSIGFLATIAGCCVFYLASYGIIGQPARVSSASVQPQSAREWVEPVLGEAIVSGTLLDLSAPKQIASAVTHLNQVTMMQYDVDQTAFGYLEAVKAWAARKTSDNAARAEMVKGRAIVNHTRNGTRHGWLSADHYVNEYNDRMIRQAEGAGSRILNDFLANWQSNLGQSIVEASLAHMSLMNKIQEEVGEAIVRVATVQTSYEEADAALQAQMGASIVAAAHAAMETGVPGSLVAAGMARSEGAVAGELKTWPEISFGDMILASTGLMGLLIGSFFMAGRPERPEAVSRTRFEPVEQRAYRRTA